MIYYFTGQPGSGKTTIGKMLYDSLEQPKMQIDGDDLRNIFNNKDYSEKGRRENIKRAQDIALFLHNKDYKVVVTLISPYKDQRDYLKNIANAIEIYLHTFEDRGKNDFHVQNYEPPTENFIDLETNSDIKTSFNKLTNLIWKNRS